jgi:hypothetical protein
LTLSCLVASGAGSCKYQGCDDIACVDELHVLVQPTGGRFEEGRYSVSTVADGDSTRCEIIVSGEDVTSTCDGRIEESAFEFALPGTPDSVLFALAIDDTLLIDTLFVPEYRETFPNACSPCLGATEAVSIPGR